MPHHLLHHVPHRLPCAAGEEEEVDECVLGRVERPPPSLRPPGAGVVQAFRSDRQKTETASPDAILTKIVTGGLSGLAGWVPAVIVWCPSACPSTAYASWGAARQSVLAGGSHPACGDVEVLNRPSRPCARPPAHCAERTSHLRPGTQFIKTFWMTEGVRTTNSSVVRCAGGGRQVAARSLHCDWRQCWVQYPCQPVDVPCPLWLAACRNAVHKVNKQPVSIKFYGCAAHALPSCMAALCLPVCLSPTTANPCAVCEAPPACKLASL